MLFESKREVGEVFETGLDEYFRRFAMIDSYLVVSMLETFPREPSAGCGPEDFLKILFEGRKAPPRQIGKLLQRKVIQKMLLHKVGEVDLTGFVESA